MCSMRTSCSRPSCWRGTAATIWWYRPPPSCSARYRSASIGNSIRRCCRNLHNLDTDLTSRMQLDDPGNQYAVIYFWGTSGLGYNAQKIAAAMPDAPTNSLAMIYDPRVVQHFQGVRRFGSRCARRSDRDRAGVLRQRSQQRIARGSARRRKGAAVDQAVRTLHPFFAIYRGSGQRGPVPVVALERRFRAGPIACPRGRQHECASPNTSCRGKAR